MTPLAVPHAPHPLRREGASRPAGTPRLPAVDGVAFGLVLVIGGATLVTLFRFLQFVAWA